MSTEYDSAKIRQLAQRISRASNAVAEVNSDSLKGVLKEMPENFRGSAATALQEEVNELMSDIRAVSSDLTALKNSLYNLAARVDYADEQAKAIIESK